MILRQLTKHEAEVEHWRVWNAYVDLLAMEDYKDLAPEQRPAHLVFWYNSEVQNGGHFQYLENRGTDLLAETIEALQLLGSPCHKEVLQDAGGAWLSRPRRHPGTAEEFCELALEGEMDSFDERFHECTPTLDQCLERYLEIHLSSFVRIT